MLERDDHWTPPDSLGYSALRPVRLTGQGKFLIVISVVLVIGAIALGIFLGRKSRSQDLERTLLRDQGVAADATVTRTWIDGSKERQPWISYRFGYAGHGYTRRVETPRKIWTGLRTGSPIQVRFVPSRPSISHPIDWDVRVLPYWLAYLIAAMLAGTASILPVQVSRQARLLAEGRPAPGRVTGFRNTGKETIVKYEFRLLNGSLFNGRSNRSKLAVVGTQVCVLYDPENPRRNALYPLCLVRLENAPSRRPKT